MNWRTLFFGAAIVVATALITSQVISQNTRERSATDEHEEMMARWAKLATPGEHHKRLNAMVGTWEYDSESWMHPGAEPTVSSGTITYTPLFDGRFVQGRYSGEFMGSVAEGMEIVGYDNFRQEYVSLWLSNMNTAIMFSRGAYRSDEKVLEMSGAYDCVMTGKANQPYRGVTRFKNDDTHVYEMFTLDPDGREFMSMRITAKRMK